jgi:hypothetical protein
MTSYSVKHKRLCKIKFGVCVCVCVCIYIVPAHLMCKIELIRSSISLAVGTLADMYPDIVLGCS